MAKTWAVRVLAEASMERHVCILALLVVHFQLSVSIQYGTLQQITLVRYGYHPSLLSHWIDDFLFLLIFDLWFDVLDSSDTAVLIDNHLILNLSVRAQNLSSFIDHSHLSRNIAPVEAANILLVDVCAVEAFLRLFEGRRLLA